MLQLTGGGKNLLSSTGQLLGDHASSLLMCAGTLLPLRAAHQSSSCCVTCSDGSCVNRTSWAAWACRARFWLCGFRDKRPLDESAAARARASVLHALPAHCLVGELSHSVELLLHLVFFGRASSQISLIEWSQVSALLCTRQTGSFGRQISGWCIAGDRHGDAGDGVGANSCSFRWWGLDLCHWFRFAAQKMLDQLLSRCWQLDAAVGALWEM